MYYIYQLMARGEREQSFLDAQAAIKRVCDSCEDPALKQELECISDDDARDIEPLTSGGFGQIFKGEDVDIRGSFETAMNVVTTLLTDHGLEWAWVLIGDDEVAHQVTNCDWHVPVVKSVSIPDFPFDAID